MNGKTYYILDRCPDCETLTARPLPCWICGKPTEYLTFYKYLMPWTEVTGAGYIDWSDYGDEEVHGS